MSSTRSSRREFLRQASCGAVGYGAAISTVLDLFKLNALAVQPAPSDYRALVCVFLYGGNDGNNLVVPTSSADYQAYAATRGNLALAQSSLLPITALNPDGRTYGLHPSMPGLQDLFTRGKMALMFNVGTLAAPLTRQEYLAGTAAVPRQLFSHSDQQIIWQSSIADQPATTGWGGRVADLLHSLNSTSSVSMSISVGGNNTFQIGRDVFQYQVSTEGPIQLHGYEPGSTSDPESRALDRLLALQHQNIFENAYGALVRNALDTQQLVSQALAAAPTFNIPFPATRLGQELKIVAQLVSARAALGQQRQVFFCAIGGFDTHTGQIWNQSDRFTEINDALVAFFDATVQLGVGENVTTFTASDFGRTFPTNGSGSDHGWGSHHLVMGDGVLGGRTYGRFPVLAVDGPDDTGQGRWIPSTSVDELAATLATWFGVSASDLPIILPNIGRFPNPSLGFLG